MLKNIKDSLEISYKQGLESDDNIYIKGQIKDWEEMLSNIKHEQELKDNALKMYDEGLQEIERLKTELQDTKEHLGEYLHEQEEENKRLNNIINELEDSIVGKINVLYQVRGQSNAIQELSILLKQLRELKGSDE